VVGERDRERFPRIEIAQDNHPKGVTWPEIIQGGRDDVVPVSQQRLPLPARRL
jgi:hypothetical protein